MDAAIRSQPAAGFPLPAADLDSLGFRREQIDRLAALIERHIAEGRYPGCQIALARHGKLALFKSFGNAVAESRPRAASDDTLWLLYSNTKVVTAVALWALAATFLVDDLPGPLQTWKASKPFIVEPFAKRGEGPGQHRITTHLVPGKRATFQQEHRRPRATCQGADRR